MGFVALPGELAAAGDQPPGTWTVYALLDPRDSLVRYVGFTRGSLGVRLARHLTRPTNTAMAEWIQSLLESGLTPRAAALEFVADQQDEWQRSERRWIAWFRERGELLNVQAGGEVTRPMLKPPDKVFPLAPGDIPSKKSNPYGARGIWDPDTNTWLGLHATGKNSSSDVVVARGRLDPRFPHRSDCVCRKCALDLTATVA